MGLGAWLLPVPPHPYPPSPTRLATFLSKLVRLGTRSEYLRRSGARLTAVRSQEDMTKTHMRLTQR